MKHRSILICMAMEGEAGPILRALDLAPVPDAFDPRLPFRAFSGHRNGAAVAVTVSGKDPRHGVDNIGTQPAALQAYLSIQAFRPDTVISAGTCGGIEAKGFRIGDVVASSGDFLFHDRVVPIPGFEAYGRGHYPAADASELARDLGLKSGAVASGNALETTARDLAFFDRHGVAAKEMEAASVAWVCWMLDLPLYALKSITDFIDHPSSTAEQFERNFHTAGASLCAQVVRAVDWLALRRDPSA